jgi:hypothetical protein
MKTFVGAGLAVITAACLYAATAGAAARTASGDTCVVNGSGTTYTILITLPPNAPEQGGFAFGASGVSITNVTVPQTSGGAGGSGGGSFSTGNLPANTTAAWNLAGPAAVPGSSITASVTTSAALTGTVTVVPANGQHTAYYDPIVCQFPKGTPTPSNAFTVASRFAYDAASGTWRSSVKVPGPGKVNFNQRKLKPTDSATLLVRSGRVSVSGAGKVTLTLHPTTAGKAALKRSGAIRLNLSIEYSPTNGKPANKLMKVTLKA